MDFVTANRCTFLDLMSLIDVGTKNQRICKIIQFKRNPSTHSLTCFRFICQVKNTASILYYISTLVWALGLHCISVLSIKTYIIL